MKNFNYILCFFIICLQSFAQTDSLNRIDADGKKQGKWIRTGKDRPGGCYKSSQVVEEGRYINNVKNGLWTEYYCNGNKRTALEFIKGRPDGQATMYFENGTIEETGTWKNNRWIGKYQKFDSIGKLIIDTVFSLPQRKQTGYTPYNSINIYQGNKNTTDTVASGPLILNGRQTLYNSKKQVTKDGVFKDNQFIEGKVYYYNQQGTLSRIAIYKDGVYISDASLEN